MEKRSGLVSKIPCLDNQRHVWKSVDRNSQIYCSRCKLSERFYQMKFKALKKRDKANSK